MSRNNGTRWKTCRYCGKKYQRNNYAVRHHAGKGFDGLPLSDTHLIACEKRKRATVVRVKVRKA